MELASRGNVPTPHNPLGAAKVADGSAAEVIFDAGNLAFVDEWLKKTGVGDTPLESGRKIGSQSQVQSKQRLGVGATAKRVEPKAEPSALEKKLLKKRQRQQEADAIAGEVAFHGIAQDEEEGESKTSSFNSSKRGRVEQGDETLKTGRKKSKRKSSGKKAPATNEIASGPETDETAGVTTRETPSLEEYQGGVRRRKARKREGQKELEGKKSDLETEPAKETCTSPVSEENAAGTGAVEANPNEVRSESSPRKRRRGWGKPRLSRDKEQASSDTIEGDSKIAAVPAGKDSSTGRNTFSREPSRKKKIRSRQKNIRRDKRPMDQRPAHLRIGGAEYSGRHLTEETMKVLGLPEPDPGTTPPTSRDPTLTDVRGEDGGKEAVLPTDGGPNGSQQESASMGVSSRKSKKSKYKNLALAPGVVL